MVERVEFPENGLLSFILMAMQVFALLSIIGHIPFSVGGLHGGSFHWTGQLWTATVVAWLLSLAAIGIALFRPVYDTRAWRWTVTALTTLTAIGIMQFDYLNGSRKIFTDVILFMRYSSYLILHGRNPYTSSMAPATHRYHTLYAVPSITQLVNGHNVTHISYPALSFLVFIPQRLLGFSDISLSVMVCLVLTLIFLVREAPAFFFPLTVVTLFYNQFLISNAMFGNIDFVWILPLLVGMHYWYRGKVARSALAVGLAFAVKPIPWLISPYLAIWLWKRPAEFQRSRWRAIGLALGVGLLGFLVPNLPFIWSAPHAWLEAVLSTVGSRIPLQTRGIGIALFSYAGLLHLPKVVFRVLELAVFAASLYVYSRWFDRVKWAAWVMPVVILWFNDRSLFNYFITFAPIAYYALLLNRDIVPKRPLIPSPRRLQTWLTSSHD